MQILDLIVQNKEIIKIIYSLIIVSICAVITLKSDKIFGLSQYKGIRYFRNAFFFYGLAFAARYLAKHIFFSLPIPHLTLAISMSFEFFMIMGGFFLLYSLLWKKIESPHEHYLSSLFNAKISLFYLMTIIIVFLDAIWYTSVGLFVSQILVFTFAFAISLSNYQQRGKDRKFLKAYALSMLLILVAWILNAGALLFLNWNILIVMIFYLLNIMVFLIFLFGVVKITKGV